MKKKNPNAALHSGQGGVKAAECAAHLEPAIKRITRAKAAVCVPTAAMRISDHQSHIHRLFNT